AKAFETTRVPFAKQSELIASVAAAHKAADAARQKLPESAALADVVKKLEESHSEAQLKLAELRKNQDAAAAAHKAVDEKFVAAQETLAAALAAGASMTEAAVLANQAAGIVVGKVGTATASAEEIIDSIR
ncbi:MAG: hypothetical protein ACXW52_22510, partial [Candidatus Binatia bacterium]